MNVCTKVLRVGLVLAAAACAQAPSGFIDAYIVKVKPEKRADFDAVTKKIAEANRKHKGDTWLTYSVEYGEGNTVVFSSVRDNYAAVDTAAAAFMNAMKEGYGPAFMKLFQDMGNCTISSRGELRRRRQDLAWNVPGDLPAVYSHIGASKWLRTLTVRVRPGHTTEFEENVKALKAALEKAPNRRPTFVSQVAVGQPTTTYYFSTYFKSMADMDPPAGSRNLRDLMGNEAYERYQKGVAADTFGSESTIYRIVPELSNPPAEIASAAPDFWNPKPAAAPKPKPKAAAPKAGD